ncbi:hypothetical protein QEG98_12340 [Myxococcus sp. MxC21-1]|nr:hypothetical protein QEG98_12340 [Myxococcus sp. MxC21-1]
MQQLLDQHASRELLRLVVVGSVDDGKSTLIGRLLYECDGLFEDQISAVRKASAKRTAAAVSVPAEALVQGLKAAAGADAEELDFSSSPTACAPSVSRASPSTLPTAT